MQPPSRLPAPPSDSHALSPPSPASSPNTSVSPLPVRVHSLVNNPPTIVMVIRGRCTVCSCLEGEFPSSGGSVEVIPCNQCKHPFRDHFPENVKPHDEEDHLLWPNWSSRSETTNELLRRLLLHDVIYVRGTPASGKTVLLTLLYHRLRKDYPQARLITLPQWPLAMSYSQSQIYTTQLLQYKLSEINRMPETILLVDEAQNTKADYFFWNTLLKSVVPTGRLKIGMFTSYGRAGAIPVELCGITPPILPDSSRIQLEREATPRDKQKVGLYLSENEAKEIFDNIEMCPPDRPIFSNDMREYLFAFTKGHVGALTSIIDAVITNEDTRDNYVLSRRPITRAACEDCLFGDITGTGFYDLLQGCPFGRGLPIREHFTDPTTTAALRELLQAPCGYLKSIGRDDLDQCYYKGVVHEALIDRGEWEFRAYIFPSPVHRWVVARFLMPPAPVSLPATSVLDFTLKILRQFVPSALLEAQNSPRNGHDRPPPEALCGNEFFRAAHRVLEGRCFPSPEFGSAKVDGGTGWMDLYIPDYKFGIEYLCAGNNIEGHAGRFLEGGSYKKWIDSGDIVEYILLDFRFTEPRDPHAHIQNLYHVIFDDNFRDVRVWNSALKEIIHFRLPET